MDDFIIKTGDMLQVTVTPPAVAPMLVAPGPLVGTSSSVFVVQMPACLEGDEIPPPWLGPMPYMAPPFVTPGIATLKVTLGPTNKTATTENGKKILLKGTAPMQVMLEVKTPAMQPTPGGPVPDPAPSHPGTAQFVTTNATVKAG